MFFYLSKLFWFVVQPSSVMLFLLLLGIAMLWSRWARSGRLLVLTAGLLLAVTGLSPLGHALILPLEERFARTDLADGAPPDGIIMLGGSQSMSVLEARRVIAVNESAERILETATLARRFPRARIIVSGRSSSMFGEQLSEAGGASAILIGLGIDKERLVLEDRSRNTYQNALFSKEIVRPKPGERWILVTSAHHMPRAMGCFRRAGFEVEPWPVDYRTRGWQDLWTPFPSPSGGWRRTDLAVREWIGLLVYWITGRSATLFPAPE